MSKLKIILHEGKIAYVLGDEKVDVELINVTHDPNTGFYEREYSEELRNDVTLRNIPFDVMNFDTKGDELRSHYAGDPEPETETPPPGYTVTFAIDARYDVENIPVSSPEDALAFAKDAVMEADFGDAHDIEWSPINVEDENGNIVWENGDTLL